MDRYLRYNNALFNNGEHRPKLHSKNYLVNKMGQILGIRFEDVDASDVVIDIPIGVIFKSHITNTPLDNEYIEDLVKESVLHNAVRNICLTDCGNTLLELVNPSKERIKVNETMEPVDVDKYVTSVYLPSCVIRYKNKWLATKGYKLLETLNNLIHNLQNDFAESLGVISLNYCRFINCDKKVIAYIKSSKAPYFIDNPHELKKLESKDFHFSINRETMDIVMEICEPQIFAFKNKSSCIKTCGWVSSLYGNRFYAIHTDPYFSTQMPLNKVPEFNNKDFMDNDSMLLMDSIDSVSSGCLYYFEGIHTDGDSIDLAAYPIKLPYIKKEICDANFRFLEDFFKIDNSGILDTICSSTENRRIAIYSSDNILMNQYCIERPIDTETFDDDTIQEIKNTIIQQFAKYIKNANVDSSVDTYAIYSKTKKCFEFYIRVPME